MTYIAIPFDKEANPFRPGTAKQLIFAWCLEQEEFTKEEFLLSLKAMLEEKKFESKMSPDTCSKAWFSELKNKAGCIGTQTEQPTA